jgi:hypothetical protein
MDWYPPRTTSYVNTTQSLCARANLSGGVWNFVTP